jgi:hypothetical protein
MGSREAAVIPVRVPGAPSEAATLEVEDFISEPFHITPSVWALDREEVFTHIWTLVECH